MEKKTLNIIEINEFNPELLSTVADNNSLTTLSDFLNWKHTNTTTTDKNEHHGLDPWVQWVNFHTGTPSCTHKTLRLGEVDKLTQPQIWEDLSDKGISSGVWGAMNARRGDADLCMFFLPDPWSFTEKAYPQEINRLLALPRYYARNYLDLNYREIITGALQALRFQLFSPSLLTLSLQLINIIKLLLKAGLKNYVLFLLFDLVSVCNFISLKKSFNTQCSLISLNSIAHLQHHHWNNASISNGPMKLGLVFFDKTLKLLLNSMPNEPAIILNVFSQKCVANMGYILYRQINPEKFLQSMGICFESVEQNMTNDAHILFKNKEDMVDAQRKLQSARIEGEPLFFTEQSKSSDFFQLFFQVDRWAKCPEDVRFTLNDQEYKFFDYFEKVVERTGAHIKEGDIYSRGVDLPDNLNNFEVKPYLLEHFSG